MKQLVAICTIIFLLAGCGPSGSLSRTPQQDKEVYQAISSLIKKPSDAIVQKSFESAYADAVLHHQKNITDARSSDQPNRWERMMNEYMFLNNLANAVQASPAALKLVSPQRYDEQVAEAKQNAADTYYQEASSLLKSSDRESARGAYTLLKQLNRIAPDYKDARSLMDLADKRSVLNVVVVPVNYYAQSFDYWGLQNDYVQQEIVRDLKYQLTSGNVKVYTENEARSLRINPDRVIELRWDQLYIPQPYSETFTKEVSQQIKTGETADKQPIYATARATLYITRSQLDANGNLTCRVTDANRENLLWDNFPGNYRWVEESATYRGDSRALSTYDWAMINNSRINNFSRRDIFTEVFRQVYPQLLSRLRGLNW